MVPDHSLKTMCAQNAQPPKLEGSIPPICRGWGEGERAKGWLQTIEGVGGYGWNDNC